MNLYLRLLAVWLSNLVGSPDHYSVTTIRAFRVWPHDLDAFGHMNNGRYLQIMDIARADWMMRTGVFASIRNNRWAPVLGGGLVRFRHSLYLAQRYHVKTRLLCWDSRWFFLEHSFLDSSDRCAAAGVTRAGIRNQGEWLAADAVVEQVCPGAESANVPEYLVRWLECEEEMYRCGADSGSCQLEALEQAG